MRNKGEEGGRVLEHAGEEDRTKEEKDADPAEREREILLGLSLFSGLLCLSEAHSSSCHSQPALLCSPLSLPPICQPLDHLPECCIRSHPSGAPVSRFLLPAHNILRLQTDNAWKADDWVREGMCREREREGGSMSKGEGHGERGRGRAKTRKEMDPLWITFAWCTVPAGPSIIHVFHEWRG